MKSLKKQTPDFEKAVFDKEGNKVSEQIGIKKGDNIISVAFGGGLTWGAVAIRW